MRRLTKTIYQILHDKNSGMSGAQSDAQIYSALDPFTSFVTLIRS